LKLSELGNSTDTILPKVLESGGEVVLAKVRGNLSSVLSGKSTGQLYAALGLSKPRLNRKGNWDIKIGFAENRSDGKSNAMLANVLEYGKHNQPPHPFMKPARTQSKSAAIDAMKSTFEDEVNKL